MSLHNVGRRSRVSIFGLGYVGSVMVACLARLGHKVIGVDRNPVKVQLLNEGRSLIVEPQLDSMLSDSDNRIRATVDPVEAVRESDVSFVCVGTPSQRAGKLGLGSVEQVCEELGAALATKDAWHTIAIRSTVLPGTVESIAIPILERRSGKSAGVNFGVCVNPEFIREGTAVPDFFHPPFTVIGTQDPRFSAPLVEIYTPLQSTVFETSIRSAEMVKYACNAFHALKIDFANEIAGFSRELGVDPHEVMEILCADTKLNISRTYLRPGFAFGGSCLPKDVGALVHCARQLDLNLPLLQSILPSNQAHIDRAYESIIACKKRKIGFLGLSFKSGTDDLRESATLKLVKRLIGEGCVVQVYDRYVSSSFIHGENRRFAETEIPHIFSMFRSTMEEVVSESDVVVIANIDGEYSRVPDLIASEQQVIDLVGLNCLPRHSRMASKETADQLSTLQADQQAA